MAISTISSASASVPLPADSSAQQAQPQSKAQLAHAHGGHRPHGAKAPPATATTGSTDPSQPAASTNLLDVTA